MEYTFSLKQQETFEKVNELQREWDKNFDPSTFVLNPRMKELQLELANLQDHCDHIWGDDNHCVVCGRVKEE